MKNLPNCYTYNELSKGLCQTCTHYIDKKDYVFRIVVKEAGEIFEAQSTSHLLLICNEGSLQLSPSPSHSFTVQSSHMLLIPEHTQWRVEVKEKCDLLFLKFDAYVNVCPYISSSTYKKYLDNQDYTFYQLELLPTMKTLTELFIQKIKLGPACLLYHKTKKLDFFSFLSMCYSDQEIARLLYPLLNTEFMLTELVQKYADKVKNVNELIELSGMSRTSFYQKFKEIYEMMPSKDNKLILIYQAGTYYYKYSVNDSALLGKRINLAFDKVSRPTEPEVNVTILGDYFEQEELRQS